MKRILELRKEDAKMLGFANFAEVSLYSKMAIKLTMNNLLTNRYD